VTRVLEQGALTVVCYVIACDSLTYFNRASALALIIAWLHVERGERLLGIVQDLEQLLFAGGGFFVDGLGLFADCFGRSADLLEAFEFTDAVLQVCRFETRMSGDARKHLGSNLFAIVESEHVIRPPRTNEHSV